MLQTTVNTASKDYMRDIPNVFFVYRQSLHAEFRGENTNQTKCSGL